jgi:hypothetical protein
MVCEGIRGGVCLFIILGLSPIMLLLLLLAAQHVRQLVFTHRLGQRQASVVLAARVVEVRMVKNS